MPEPYASVPDDALTLRDQLALDRTVLANERTLLAYLRTALALLAGGVALFQLVNEPWARAAGWAALPLASLILAHGVFRFGRVRRRLRSVSDRR